MPQIPTVRDLGKIRIAGDAKPAQINPNVALSIGRAGAAWAHALESIGSAFDSLAAKRQAMDDATWLSDAKIKTLESDDAIRRDTELNASPDGTGYEQAPARFKSSVEDIQKQPGGSPEARQRYQLWSAERGYETGRWAANAAQGRLKQSTLSKLDDRLNTMSSLASSNPDQADEYLKAYEEEVSGYVGSAISAQDAQLRIENARSTIGKASIITRAIQNPGDFGKAMKAIEDTRSSFEAINPETRARPMQTAAGEPASVSTQLETGKTDPLKGVAAINTHDSGGTHSYGNFGLNSGGSAQQFAAQYGDRFGLTATPGTPEFDKQWRNAAKAAPVELHDAEMQWWQSNIGSKVTNTLVRAGVASDVANDPRVVAYFADRSVQQGPASIANHAGRINQAFTASKGDVGDFLARMSRLDKANVAGDFRTALATGAYSERANDTRVNGRERLSMGLGAGAVTTATRPQPAFDLSRLPKINGSIQPAEILKLAPEDQARVIKELAPYLQVEMTDRMNRAVAAIGAKGSQTIITPEDIDNAAPLIGAKNAAKWKEALTDAKTTYDVTTEAKGLSRDERYARLRDMVPSGNPEDLAGAERQRFDIWNQVVNQINKAVKTDPLGYVSMENESGRQAMKVIAGADPGAAGTPSRERAYDTLMELQKREGVPQNEIRILPTSQADAVVKGLQDAKTGPAAMLQIEGLRQTYGKEFNQLWGELVDHGAPQTYLALRTATRAGQDGLVQSYALEHAMGEGKETKKDLLLARAGAKQTELNQAVTNQTIDFLSALEHKSSSQRLIESYRQATERLSLYYMTQGKGLSDAVASAADELYGKNLSIYHGVIIPKDVDNQIGAEVRRTLTAQGSQFKALIAPYEDKIVSNIRVSGIYSPGYERQRFLDNIRTSPKFVTNETATGVYVLDQNNDYVLVDEGNGPAPLSFTWDQLAKAPLPSVYDRLPGAN